MTDLNIASSAWRPQRFFAHQVRSTQELERLNDGGGLAVEFFRISRPAPQLRVEGGQSRSMSLWLTTSATGFLTVPTLEADLFTIRFVMSGQMIRRNHRHQENVTQGYATFSALADMRNGEASPDFSAISSTITHETLLTSYHLLEGRSDRQLPSFEPMVSYNNPGTKALLLSIQRIYSQLVQFRPADDLFFPLLEEVFTYQLLSAWPRSPAISTKLAETLSAAHLRRAIDYIHAGLAMPLKLSDIANSAGVSVRMLQIAFKRELGMTPVEYIIECRLQQVRSDICSEKNRDTSIAELGRRWGFAHMSDLARRYRNIFGCTPSQMRRSAEGKELDK